MIEIKTTKGKIDMKGVGTISEISADICLIVKSIYDGLKEDPDSAGYFKHFIRDMLYGLVFCEDEEKKDHDIKDDIEVSISRIEDMLDDLKKSIGKE